MDKSSWTNHDETIACSKGEQTERTDTKLYEHGEMASYLFLQVARLHLSVRKKISFSHFVCDTAICLGRRQER